MSSISYLCQEKELSISPHEYRGFSTSLQTPLCLGMFLSPESGRSVQQIDRLSMLSSLFGSGPDGYPLQLSAGSLHSPFIPPLHQNWMPGAWIEINVRGCTCFLLCLSDHSFPSPVFVQRQDGLVFKSSSSSFLSQGSSEDDHSFLSLLHPPRQLVRGVWTEDGRHLSSPWMVHPF